MSKHWGVGLLCYNRLENLTILIIKSVVCSLINSFTSLYLTYKILNLNRSYTECKDLDVDINFNSSRVFDTKNCDISKLLQCMQTERLIIEVRIHSLLINLFKINYGTPNGEFIFRDQYSHILTNFIYCDEFNVFKVFLQGNLVIFSTECL